MHNIPGYASLHRMKYHYFLLHIFLFFEPCYAPPVPKEGKTYFPWHSCKNHPRPMKTYQKCLWTVHRDS